MKSPRSFPQKRTENPFVFHPKFNHEDNEKYCRIRENPLFHVFHTLYCYYDYNIYLFYLFFLSVRERGGASISIF